MLYFTSLVPLLALIRVASTQLNLPAPIPVSVAVDAIMASASPTLSGVVAVASPPVVKEGAITVPSVSETINIGGLNVTVVEILPSQVAPVVGTFTPISILATTPSIPLPCLLGHVARLETNGSTTCLPCDAHVRTCTISPDTGLTIATKCSNPMYFISAGKCLIIHSHGPVIKCQIGFAVVTDALTKTSGCGMCDSLTGVCSIVQAAINWGAPTLCAPGYSFNDGVCNICSAGSFAGFNTTSCSNCTTNTYSAPGAGHCSNCAPGFVSLPSSASCNMCANGTFATPDLGCVSCMATGVTSCSPVNGTVHACLPNFSLTNGTCILPKLISPKTYLVKMNCRGATVSTISNNVTSCTACGFGVASCSSFEHSPTNITVSGCLAGYFYSNNQCSQCSVGTGSEANNKNSICSNCRESATRCSTKPVADIACTTGFYLHQSRCQICTVASSTLYNNTSPACLICPGKGKGTKDCDFNVHPANILSCLTGYVYSMNGNVGTCTTLVE